MSPLATKSSNQIAARSNAVNWEVSINGTALSSTVVPKFLGGTVQSVLRGPATCELLFSDHEFEMPLAAQPGFKIGSKIVVKAKDAAPPDATQSATTLFDGLIVAVDVSRAAMQTTTRLRCADRLSFMYHGRIAKGHLEKTPADAARAACGQYGITAGTIDTISTKFEFLPQWNESDGEFLERLAAEFGFTFRVREGKLDFCKLPAASGAPSPASPGSSSTKQLVLGDDILRFDVSYSAERLVDKVVVRGWDPKTKKEIVGESPVGSSPGSKFVSSSPTVAGAVSDTPAPNAIFRTSGVPTRSVAQAKSLAESIASEIASTFARVEALVIGNPGLLAGTAISIGPSSHPFAGKYVITTAEHVLEEGVWNTRVVCGGLEDRGLGGQVAAAPAAAPAAALPAVTIGLVTNNKDPEDRGRVKVKLPQFGDDIESGWLRVVMPGAGPSRGLTVYPEVNDEVVVAFENGDAREGYVIGGVWNGKDKPDHKSQKDSIADGKVEKRGFTSRTGHSVVFTDKQGQEAIEVSSGSEKLLIKLDQNGKSITISNTEGPKTTLVLDDKGLTITTDKDVAVKATGNINLEATQDVSIKGLNVKVEAQSNFEAKANANAKLEGTAGVEVKSTGTAKLDGTQTTVSGAAMTEVKGALVKIN